jgi:hypothetical protein
MCPSQRNSLLFVLEALDPGGSKVIKFDVTNVKTFFPYHAAFQIHVGYSKYTIKCIFIDEGTATCMMSLVCWKALNSLTLSQSPTILTSFEGHSFLPHGILPTFSIHLCRKTMEVDVMVVEAPLDYNLLLGCNWTYDMTTIASPSFILFSFLTMVIFPNNNISQDLGAICCNHMSLFCPCSICHNCLD